MTKQHPFDDFHQRIHWSGTSIGTVTIKGFQDKKKAEALMSLLKH